MIDEQTQGFIDAYRDALGRQKDLNFQAIENAKRNAYTDIMSGANTAGMMYSNFPERSKMQYSANTYMPAIEKAQSSYQTGLDSLRNSITQYTQKLKEINDAMTNLNNTTMQNAIGARLVNNAGDMVYNDISGGSQFINANGDPVRFGRVADNSGFTGDENILLLAQNTLNADDYARLKRIWDAQQNTSHPNFSYNYGDNYQEPGYEWLSPEDNAFLGRLGLSFGF